MPPPQPIDARFAFDAPFSSRMIIRSNSPIVPLSFMVQPGLSVPVRGSTGAGMGMSRWGPVYLSGCMICSVEAGGSFIAWSTLRKLLSPPTAMMNSTPFS